MFIILGFESEDTSSADHSESSNKEMELEDRLNHTPLPLVIVLSKEMRFFLLYLCGVNVGNIN